MKRLTLCGFVVCVVAVFVGCGTGKGQDLSGRASIAIEWPEPGRLIPKAANFVRVRAVTTGGAPVGTQPPAVGRPTPPASSTSVITIDNLPVGANITFIAEAFSQNPDAVGGQTAQASGQQTLLIRNDAPNTFDISMASTVGRVTFERNGVTIGEGETLNLVAGEDANLAAQARTAGTPGALVLVDPNNWAWTSGNTNLKINSTTTATGPTVVARGHATVTAALNIMETESNVPGSLNIQVVQPLYPGAVDGAIAADATGFGDVAAGPMDTKAVGDRAFALITRLDPFGKFSQREVDIHDSETLAIVGNWVPTFGSTRPNNIVRNTSGIAMSYDPEISPPGTAVVVNWRDTGAINWSQDQLDSLIIEDMSARKSHTYVLQDGPGVGFRVTKLRDATGQIVKQFLAPNGSPATTNRITVDDEENVYFGHGDTSPWVSKIDKNGDRQPFDVTNNSFQNVVDIDFDQGLVYVMDSTAGGGNMGRIYVFGQSGTLVQTIPIPGSVDDSPLRMSTFRGQIFIVTTGGGRGGFAVRKVFR